MILFKNVDICDLKSIVQNGVLSLDKCENNNWDDGKRAENDTSVVYLFKPISSKNTFPNYGAALLEVDCEAKENILLNNDTHKNDYKEYVTSEVLPEQIKRIYIPIVFKSRIRPDEIPDETKVQWCDMKADKCVGYDKRKKQLLYEQITEDELEQFAKTAPLNTTDYNYFRGDNEDRTVLDLYNIKYIW